MSKCLFLTRYHVTGGKFLSRKGDTGSRPLYQYISIATTTEDCFDSNEKVLSKQFNVTANGPVGVIDDQKERRSRWDLSHSDILVYLHLDLLITPFVNQVLFSDTIISKVVSSHSLLQSRSLLFCSDPRSISTSNRTDSKSL